MNRVAVREMHLIDYAGVRQIDELTQKQYLSDIWDNLTEVEKDNYLKSRRSEFETNVATGYCNIAAIDEQVIGFILAHEMLPFRGTIYIRHIAVHPDYQSQGVGLQLYQAVIDQAEENGIKKIMALINLDNPQSIRLHQKMAFELIDRKQAFLVLK